MSGGIFFGKEKRDSWPLLSIQNVKFSGYVRVISSHSNYFYRFEISRYSVTSEIQSISESNLTRSTVDRVSLNRAAYPSRIFAASSLLFMAVDTSLARLSAASLFFFTVYISLQIYTFGNYFTISTGGLTYFWYVFTAVSSTNAGMLKTICQSMISVPLYSGVSLSLL